MGKRGPKPGSINAPRSQPPDEARWRAMQKGYDAYGNGVDLDDNPYPKGNLLRQPWSQGWVQRRKDEKGYGYKGMKKPNPEGN
jgi:ribosome modulation factor